MQNRFKSLESDLICKNLASKFNTVPKEPPSLCVCAYRKSETEHLIKKDQPEKLL